MNKLALTIFATTLIAAGCADQPPAGLVAEPSTTPAIHLPDDMLMLWQVEPALSTKRPNEVPTGTRLAIIPHHLVAMREIVSLFASWPSPKPKTVYLLSPDHFSNGRTSFATMVNDFEYANGRVMNAPALTRTLAESVAGVSVDSRVIVREHGIGALIPLFDKTMTETRIIPITVRIDAQSAELVELSSFLAEQLEDPDVAVIASIDMSHYLPAEFADLHDAYTTDIIRLLDAERSHMAEIDSPGSLFVILDLARRLALGDVRIHAHTNSLRLLNALVTDEGTSHILATFSPGSSVTERSNEAILFAPFGIPTLENRLYYGQDGIRPTLEGFPNVAVSIVRNNDGTRIIGIVPLTDAGIYKKIMPREQRLKLVETWKQDGTWAAIVKQLEKQL